MIRLNKFLALRLGVSRREADNLITKGAVTVNDIKPVLGAQVALKDKIVVNGKPLDTKPPKHIYLLMNKPTGYVCSRRQQGDAPTIYSLLPPEYQHLKTVGRLDKDSSGLIMLTNDGDFAHHLTHPKFAKIKMYEVQLDKPLAPEDLHALNRGVALKDGLSKLYVTEDSRHSSLPAYIITMHEGRNRQIRRTFAALGYLVTRLHRTQFGELLLGSLDSGQSSNMSIGNKFTTRSFNEIK